MKNIVSFIFNNSTHISLSKQGKSLTHSFRASVKVSSSLKSSSRIDLFFLPLFYYFTKINRIFVKTNFLKISKHLHSQWINYAAAKLLVVSNQVDQRTQFVHSQIRTSLTLFKKRNFRKFLKLLFSYLFKQRHKIRVKISLIQYKNEA